MALAAALRSFVLLECILSAPISGSALASAVFTMILKNASEKNENGSVSSLATRLCALDIASEIKLRASSSTPFARSATSASGALNSTPCNFGVIYTLTPNSKNSGMIPLGSPRSLAYCISSLMT